MTALGDETTDTPPEYMDWIRGLEDAGKGNGRQ
jgi:hypothetical protein